ncbi:MAG: ribosome maturation factor RimM [Proteobacteria bacterium]|nr:ribosome maturation factor RimM [Pseudomonadota bacterium]
MSNEVYIPVGRIVSTHSIKGEAKFRYYNEDKEVFYRYTSFFIKDGDGWGKLELTGISFRKGFFHINFKGLEKPEDLSYLINRELFVKEEDLPQLSENEYYEYQLLGLDVFSENGEELGKVAQIIRTGANDVMLVRGEKEILIPMIEDYISEINVKKVFIKLTNLFTEFPGN